MWYTLCVRVGKIYIIDIDNNNLRAGNNIRSHREHAWSTTCNCTIWIKSDNKNWFRKESHTLYTLIQTQKHNIMESKQFSTCIRQLDKITI